MALTSKGRPRKVDEIKVKERRQRVAQLYLQGRNQYQIAAVENISQKTICKDLQAIRESWLASSVRDFDLAKSQELAKLERLEAEAWSAWTRSLEDVTTTRNRTENARGQTSANGRPARGMVPVLQTSETTVKKATGDPRFLDTIQRCCELRLKVLGALKPGSTNAVQLVNVDWSAIMGVTNTPFGSVDQSDDIELKIASVNATPPTSPIVLEHKPDITTDEVANV